MNNPVQLCSDTHAAYFHSTTRCNISGNVLQKCPAGSEANPDSSSLATGVNFWGSTGLSMTVATNHHVEPKLRMGGAILLFAYIPS